MSTSIVAHKTDRYCVEVAYPGPMFEDLDELLDRLAVNYGGAMTSSGIGFVEGWVNRDIEFTFDDEGQARDFASKATCVIGVRVTSIEPS